MELTQLSSWGIFSHSIFSGLAAFYEMFATVENMRNES